MTTLKTDYANQPLRAGDLAALAKHSMYALYSLGKGVSSGMDVSAGPGLALTVQPGEFQAQVPDKLPSVHAVPVAPNTSGYLWVEANSNDSDIPNFDTQTIDADYGTNWVCLGHYVAGTTTVQYDPAGRTQAGYKATAATTEAQVTQAVTQTVAPMIAAVRVEFNTEILDGKVDGTRTDFALMYAPMDGGIKVDYKLPDGSQVSLDNYQLVQGQSGGQTVYNVLRFTPAPPSGTTLRVQYPYNP